MVSQWTKIIKPTHLPTYIKNISKSICAFGMQKHLTQDTYHVTVSKMDEFEVNYIFNELDTILELIHANCIVRNVRHILISTAVKTLTLENVYERFVLEVKHIQKLMVLSS